MIDFPSLSNKPDISTPPLITARKLLYIHKTVQGTCHRDYDFLTDYRKLDMWVV